MSLTAEVTRSRALSSLPPFSVNPHVKPLYQRCIGHDWGSHLDAKVHSSLLDL